MNTTKKPRTKAWIAWLLALGTLIFAPVSAQAVVVIPMTLRASLDATCGNADDANPLTVEKGTTIYMCYKIENSLPTQETLFNVTIHDPKVASISPASATIPLFGSAQFISTPIVAQASDVHAITVTGAKAGGRDAFTRGPNYISYFVVESKLAIATTVSTNGSCPGQEVVNVPAGENLTWCYTVTNIGTSTVNNITVTDDIYGAVTGSIATLAPGASYTLSRADISSTDLVLTAVANGTSAQTGAPVVSNYDPAVVHVVAPDIDIDVTVSTDGTCPGVDATTVLIGTPVTYCYLVTNDGSEDLINVHVENQDNVTIADLASLAIGQSVMIVGPTAPANTLHIETGTATGSDVFDNAVSDEDSAKVTVVAPSLAIEKTVSTTGDCPGSESVTVLTGTTVTYCYTVTNTGDVTINNIIVTDDGNIINVGTLTPGEATIVSAPYTATMDTVTAAVASGTENILNSPVVSPPNDAYVDVISPSLSISTTVSTDGTCPGSEVVNVLIGTQVTWCYVVTNTGDVAVNGVTVTDDQLGLIPGTADIPSGGSATFSTTVAANNDQIDNASANGTDAVLGSSVTSNLDPAAVNVVTPTIDIDVTVSTNGVCPGVDSVTVVAGSSINYCYVVTNFGDDPLVNVVVTDADNNVLFTIPSLGVGESYSYTGPAETASTDGSETATASGTDIYGFPVSDSDSAFVHVIFANLTVTKSAPAQLNYTSGGTAIAYTINVTNLGEATAIAPVVTDPLPAGSSFVSASSSTGSCAFASGTVTCTLADLGPGQSASITINTLSSVTSGTVTNNVIVSTSTPETNYSDNSASASTVIIAAGGATRTIGFYATHPTFTAACLAANGGAINLGFVTLRNENYDNEIDGLNGPDKDNRVETGIAMAMGVLNANIVKYRNKQARPALEKERMKAGQQLLAAICNATYLGTPPPFSIAAAQATLAGTDIAAINQVNNQADAYNNSGDAFGLPVSPGPADTKFAWDDPTDIGD